MTSLVTDSIHHLSSPDESTRWNAAEEMSELRDPDAIPALVIALGDRSAAVRESVINALTAIGGEETAIALIPLLASEDPPSRNAACEILRKIGSDAAGPLQQAVLTGGRDVRLFAIDILALAGGPGLLEILSTAIADPDSNVATSAATALGQTGGADSAFALVAARSADPWVRCAVAESLGRIGGSVARRALVASLSDPEDSVRHIAAQSLGDCGDVDSVSPLILASGDTNPLVATTALEAIDRVTERLTPHEIIGIRGRVALDPIREILNSDDRASHPQALRVLERMLAGDSSGGFKLEHSGGGL